MLLDELLCSRYDIDLDILSRTSILYGYHILLRIFMYWPSMAVQTYQR